MTKKDQTKVNQKDENLKDDLLEKVEELEQAEEKENALIEKLEQDLQVALAKIEELQNAYARAMADLQNFKRRTEEEKRDLGAFANAKLILDFLPVVDNFERAIAHKPENIPQEWLDGVMQIHTQFNSIFEKQGLEEIQTIGEKYNPNLHEALLQTEGENDIITQTLEKGYLLNGKVLRAAKVAVGNGQKK